MSDSQITLGGKEITEASAVFLWLERDWSAAPMMRLERCNIAAVKREAESGIRAAA
jgi:hypothetical protein